MPAFNVSSQHPGERARSLILSRVKLRRISERTSVITLIGEHDLASKPRLLEALARALQSRNVIIDLSPCTFIDSTTVAALLAAQDVQRADSTRRLLVALPPGDDIVNRALTLIGLRLILPVQDSLERALQSLRESTDALTGARARNRSPEFLTHPAADG